MTSYKQKSKQINYCSQLNFLTAICEIQIDFRCFFLMKPQQNLFYEIFLDFLSNKKKISEMQVSNWLISFQNLTRMSNSMVFPTEWFFLWSEFSP